MRMKHIPVLLQPILDLTPEHSRFGADVTFGRGGHTSALLEKLPQLKIFGLDRDQAALDYGKEHFSPLIEQNRLELLHANFAEFPDVFREKIQSSLLNQGLDFILADLGVSSPQLDEGERGFSFYHDGPLDMRMDQSRGVTAADIVNSTPEPDLLEIFRLLGEIRDARRVVRAIVTDRESSPFQSTKQLAGLIERIEGWHRKGHHPATRYFLALRLAVNGELDQVKEAIPHFIQALASRGRLLVITFHSLEDRIAKIAFKAALDQGHLVNKKVIQPSWDEQKKNPRARSAKLRVFEKS